MAAPRKDNTTAKTTASTAKAKITPAKNVAQIKSDPIVESTQDVTTPSTEELLKLVQNLTTELEKVKADKTSTVDEKPKINNRRKALPTIDLQEQIPCISRVEGGLIYKSNKTGSETQWANYGDLQYLSFEDIVAMNASQPRFIKDVWLVIDDDEVIDFLALETLYEQVFKVEDLDAFLLENSRDELRDILPTLPSGIKKSIGTRAKKMVEDGSLDSRAKILLLEEELKICLINFD